MNRSTFQTGIISSESYVFVPSTKGKDRIAYTTNDSAEWKYMIGFWTRASCSCDAAHVTFLGSPKSKLATHLYVVWEGGHQAVPESLTSIAEYRSSIRDTSGPKSIDLAICFYPINRIPRVFELLRSWDSNSIIALGFARVDFGWIGGIRNA